MTKKELLSAVVFIRHFRPYLLGRTFQLRTDHSSLTWLHNFKEPEGQLARWLEQLQEHNFDIIHRPGTRHSNADAMSQRPSCKCQQCSPESNTRSNVIDPTESSVAPNGQAPETPEAKVYNAQLGDKVVGPILRAMQGGRRPTDAKLAREQKEVRQLAQQWEQLIIHNQSLYRKFENAQGSQHHYPGVCSTRSYKKPILESWEVILERRRH